GGRTAMVCAGMWRHFITLRKRGTLTIGAAVRCKAVESHAVSVLPTWLPFAMATVPRLRKPMASTAVLSRRRRVMTVGIVLTLGIAGVLAYILAGCGGGSTPAPPAPPPPVAFQALSASEVTQIATAAAASVSTDTLVIAVVDRQGKVL